jgi:hypothetical protein
MWQEFPQQQKNDIHYTSPDYTLTTMKQAYFGLRHIKSLYYTNQQWVYIVKITTINALLP